jgi:hypothetical protein
MDDSILLRNVTVSELQDCLYRRQRAPLPRPDVHMRPGWLDIALKTCAKPDLAINTA